MNSPNLSRWIEIQKKKKNQAQLLETALLTGKMGPYYQFRFRYFALKALLSILIITLQVKILYEGFGESGFFKEALGAGAILTLLTGFWWAGLETMRSEIRKQKRSENGGILIPQILILWKKITQTVTLWVGGLVFGGTLLWILLKPSPNTTPFDFYLLALCLRLTLEIPLRAFHSSVYATRRIYKPLGWVLGIEALGFLLFTSTHPFLGAWSVGVSAIFVAILNFIVSWKYIQKVFRHLGYQNAIKILKKKPKKPYPAPKITYFLQEAIPLTLFRLDGLLLIILALSQQELSTQTLPQFVLLALAIPMIHTTQEWAQLLYFDFKKLELNLFDLLRKRFEESSKFMPLILAACLWGCLVPSWSFVQENISLPPWELFFLFAASSALAQQAIKYFSLGLQSSLTFWGASLLFGFFVLHLGGAWISLTTVFLFAAFLLALHTIGMQIAFKKRNISTVTQTLLPLGYWVHQLHSENRILQGAWIQIEKDESISSTHLKLSIVKGLKKALLEHHPQASLYATTCKENQLLIFTPLQTPSLQSLLPTLCGPSLQNFQTARGTNSKILAELSKKEPDLLATSYKLPIWTLTSPTCFDLTQKNPEVYLSSSDAQEILHNAIEFLKKGTPPRKEALWDVTTEENEGILTKIYAFPIKTPWKIRQAWRHHIRLQTIQNSWPAENLSPMPPTKKPKFTHRKTPAIRKRKP